MGRRQRVVVDDAVDGVVLLLERDVVPDRAEVVAEVGDARRLDAAEDPRRGRRLPVAGAGAASVVMRGSVRAGGCAGARDSSLRSPARNRASRPRPWTCRLRGRRRFRTRRTPRLDRVGVVVVQGREQRAPAPVSAIARSSAARFSQTITRSSRRGPGAPAARPPSHPGRPARGTRPGGAGSEKYIASYRGRIRSRPIRRMPCRSGISRVSPQTSSKCSDCPAASRSAAPGMARGWSGVCIVCSMASKPTHLETTTSSVPSASRREPGWNARRPSISRAPTSTARGLRRPVHPHDPEDSRSEKSKNHRAPRS